METQTDLELGIGTKEMEKLKPQIVKIVKVRVEEVGDKKNEKLVCSSKHPSKEEPIDISSIRYLKNDKVTTTGLWINKDEDGMIRKGSALAVLMTTLQADILKQLEGKEVATIQDENGYLCFKVY